MAKKHHLGWGRLGWLSEERIYGKYGSVTLDFLVDPMKFAGVHGRRGTLEAVVDDNEKQSNTLYDPMTGIKPSMPKVGDSFVLGEGILNVYTKYGLTNFGIEREDGKVPVLNVDALYKAVDQYIDLYFVEEEDSTEEQ